MATASLRVVVPPVSGACAKCDPFQIKTSSVRLRAELVAARSALHCQTEFTCSSSASGNVERRVPRCGRPAAKWVCSALVEQKDVLPEGGEEVFQALEQLREIVEQKGGDIESADDMELLRFLRTRSMDLEKAATAFVSHQKWRADFVPNGRFTEADLPTELDAKKLYWIAQDKKGRPVMLTMGRNHVYNKQDFTEFSRTIDERKGKLQKIKAGVVDGKSCTHCFLSPSFAGFVVYAVDKVIAGAPPGNEDFLAIVDLKGLGVKNLDSKSFIAAFDLLQNHYPGRIDKIFMVNVPLIFNGLWKFVSKFLEEDTREKIIFVEKKKLTQSLLEEIDIDYLPKEYGGNADLLLLQDAKIDN